MQRVKDSDYGWRVFYTCMNMEHCKQKIYLMSWEDFDSMMYYGPYEEFYDNLPNPEEN
jgi:hypothetical protein